MFGNKLNTRTSIHNTNRCLFRPTFRPIPVLPASDCGCGCEAFIFPRSDSKHIDWNRRYSVENISLYMPENWSKIHLKYSMNFSKSLHFSAKANDFSESKYSRLFYKSLISMLMSRKNINFVDIPSLFPFSARMTFSEKKNFHLVSYIVETISHIVNCTFGKFCELMLFEKVLALPKNKRHFL